MSPSPSSRGGSSNDRSEAYNDIKSEFASGNVKEGISNAAHQATRVAKESATAALDQAKKVADQVQTGYDKVCHYASEHPTTAILIALGVGAIVGRLLIPRKF